MPCVDETVGFDEVWPTGRPMMIAIAGGSGSGKTTISQAVVEAIGPDRAVLIEHDSYYRDLRHLDFEERVQVNYDHPDSLETPLLIEHLRRLRNGESIAKPRYDFSTHLRLEETDTVPPRPVIIVEGILILAEPELRELMDLRIYVDTDADLRLVRRIRRDVEDRGRSPETVLAQYEETVRPMHLQFVEPAKRYADLIIPEGYNTNAVGTVIGMIREYLRHH